MKIIKTNSKGAFFLSLIVLLVLGFMYSSKPFFTHASSGRAIDIFSQKSPSGQGINQSSGPFQPRELVALYALVTYNEYPMANMFVSFVVRGPINPSNNITIIRSAATNESGLARIDFRISLPPINPDEIVLGTWLAVAVVNIAEQKVVDTLTFEVYVTSRIVIPRCERFLETLGIFTK